MIGLRPAVGQLRVLCVGAHPDDIEIGCGGTLLGLSARPSTSVSALVMTGSGSSRESETRSALEAFSPGAKVTVLGLADGRLPDQWKAVKQSLEDAARENRPDLILAPRPQDAHQDHRLLGRLVTTVWRDSVVLQYEIPKWDADLVTPNHYVPVPATAAERKFELLDRHFPSQRTRDWWDREMFLGLMRIRGVECRQRYAEGFLVGKAVLDFN